MERRKNLSVCKTTFHSVPELTRFVGLYTVEGLFLSRADDRYLSTGGASISMTLIAFLIVGDEVTSLGSCPVARTANDSVCS